jgi:hypothetical protein
MDSAETRPRPCPQYDEATGWRCAAQTVHDTYSAYRQGCRSEMAKADSARYKKYWRNLRQPRRLHHDYTGVTRRIQAAMFMGWSFKEMERVSGVPARTFWVLLHARQPSITEKVRAKMVPALERMAMTSAPKTPGNGHLQTRNHARRQGFRSLMAWDDIDDPNEQPPAPVTQLSRQRKHPMSRAPETVEIDEHLLEHVLDPLSSTRFDELSIPEQDHVVERLWRDAVARNFEFPSQRVAEQLNVDEPRRIQRIRERYRRRYQREQEAS